MGQIKNIKLHIVTDIKMIASILKHELTAVSKLTPMLTSALLTTTRNISTTEPNCNKRKWTSKWKRQPTQVYTELLDPSVIDPHRCFDKVLQYRGKTKLWRRKYFRKELAQLVKEERIITTVGRGMALARLAEYLIENAKAGDDLVVETLVQGERGYDEDDATGKERKVYEVLVPRFAEQDGKYIDIYRLHWTAKPFYNPIAGPMYRRQVQVEKDENNPLNNRYLVPNREGYCVIEFKGNDLPPVLLPDDELEKLTLGHYTKKRDGERQLRTGIKF